ncbi:MAG: hypothetical protein ABI459_05410 [Deltaproteobacteria bacterium]
MQDLDARADSLSALITEKLGTRGPTFAIKIRRLGRSLPRPLRREADLIVKALKLQSHPKLAGRVNERRLERAFTNLTKYIDRFDPWQRRRALALSIAQSFAFGLLAFIVLALALVWWRGLL